jgi:hypothetical protein
LCETISCLFNYATPILSVFSNFLILLLLFFCPDLIKAVAMQRLYKPKRLSIQYV